MTKINEFSKDYCRVFSTLQSCQKTGQLDVAKQYYENFKKKWKKDIESNDETIKQLSLIYDREYNDHFNLKDNLVTV